MRAKFLFILVAMITLNHCCSYAQRRVRVQCAKPVDDEFYIFQLNGKFYTTGTLGILFLMKRKDVQKGKQFCMGKSKLGFLFKLHLGFSSVPHKYPKGAHVFAYKGNNKPVDTIVFNGVVLKYPLEIDGAFDDATTANDALIVLDSFTLVNHCATYGKKHFELYTKK